jgi:hypothetical protein
MSPSLPIVVATALLATTLHAAQITWSSIAFLSPGEYTPALSTSIQQHLTPLGAHQLLNAGAALRARYIRENSTTFVPIHGLATTKIDNSQLDIVALDYEWVVTGAQAFMQGLYPAIEQAYVDEDSMLGNGTLVDFPAGLQLANVETVSDLDWSYVWWVIPDLDACCFLRKRLQLCMEFLNWKHLDSDFKDSIDSACADNLTRLAGNIDCPNYSIAAVEYVSTPAYSSIYTSTLPFYQSLIPSLFHGISPAPDISYYNAPILYDYASYQYVHNRSITSTISSSTMDQLRMLASSMEFALNGNLTLSHGIRTIAGKTMAGRVLTQFSRFIYEARQPIAMTTKLAMLFTSTDPFLSFFALSSLASKDQFTGLPLPGSIMAFELFSNSETSNVENETMPAQSELYVRFLFRNGTDDTAELLSYSLFNRGNSEVDMPYSTFVSLMQAIAIDDIGTWCNTCHSSSSWCIAFEEYGSFYPAPGSCPSSGNATSQSPVIAGIIGAVIMLAAIVLLAGVGALGRTLRRKHRDPGGFKGRQRLGSDVDVSAKGGVADVEIRTERVGSWELREDDAGAAKLNMFAGVDSHAKPPASKDLEVDLDRECNPYGEPVKIDDRV